MFSIMLNLFIKCCKMRRNCTLNPLLYVSCDILGWHCPDQKVFKITKLFTHTFLDLHMNTVINRVVRGNAEITAWQARTYCLHCMCQCPTVLCSPPCYPLWNSLPLLISQSYCKAAVPPDFFSFIDNWHLTLKYFNEHYIKLNKNISCLIWACNQSTGYWHTKPRASFIINVWIPWTCIMRAYKLIYFLLRMI